MRKNVIQLGLLILVLGAGYVLAGDNRFCAGPVPQAGVSVNRAHVVGDQSLEHAVEQVASVGVCSAGHFASQ